MMLRRSFPFLIIGIVVIASVASGYSYVAPLFSAYNRVNSSVIVIKIPKGSSMVPTGFSVHEFQANFVNGSYDFPVNVSVRIGANNTIEWVNYDTTSHDVTALVFPAGAVRFNSGFFGEGKTFSASLTVPGVYKYTCAWHNWLAGQITVKSA